ncbi:MAG: hypothetical protein RDV48_31085 [Candidatus Eremiobacteraeota bacterium]|nr:hypothetical protein [Candidatus Eremiobacteraeota bacterium]
MADYTDPGEIDEIDEYLANRPPPREIVGMCRILGIEQDNLRTIKKDDAWAYYRELKAMVEAKQRKTA